MTEPVSLDEIRDRLRRAQRERVTDPTEPEQQVTVDNEGKIFLGKPRDGRPVSTVHQGLFALLVEG